MIYSRVRPRLRQAVFDFVRRICETEDGREILAYSLRGLLAGRPQLALDTALAEPVPYPDLARFEAADAPAGPAPIFVTGRFRSGTTLLWNIFRHIDGCTSYYEP
jgi:hypothetical protein